MDDSGTEAEARAALARRAARAGAAVAEDWFRRDLAVETKSGATDLVTRADREAQRAAAAVIDDARPDETLVAEEADAGTTVPASGPAWVVDPVDGTNNFVGGSPTWATSVASVRDAEPLAGATVAPVPGDVYAVGPDGVTRNGEEVAVSDRTDPETFTVAPLLWWHRGRREEYAALLGELVRRFDDLRRIGSAQLALAAVAAGGLDGAVTTVDATENPWDTVAGAHMVARAGGRVTDLEGEPWRHDSSGLVASNGAAHGELLAAARTAVSAGRSSE